MRDLKNKLEEFIKSDKECIDLDMLPISELGKILIELGFDKLELDGDETNGWQIDFWYKFNHSELGTYTLSGSLHYGNFKLSKE